MSDWVIVPDWLNKEIDYRLRAAMPEDATEEDFATCKAQLLRHYDEFGELPDFGVKRREHDI